MCRPALLRRRPVIFSVSAPPPQPNANSSLHAAPHFIVSLCPVPFSVREVFCCVSPSCCKRVLIAGRRLGRGNQLKAALHGAAPGPGAAGGPPPRASLQREVASGAVRRSAVCSWGRLFARLALFFLGHAPVLSTAVLCLPAAHVVVARVLPHGVGGSHRHTCTQLRHRSLHTSSAIEDAATSGCTLHASPGRFFTCATCARRARGRRARGPTTYGPASRAPPELLLVRSPNCWKKH